MSSLMNEIDASGGVPGTPDRKTNEWQLVLYRDGEAAYWNSSPFRPAGNPRPAAENIRLVQLPNIYRYWRPGDVMRYYAFGGG